MSFDPKSLQRLRELGRKLPEPLPSPTNTSSKTAQSNKPNLHPIETEQDPEKLFKELIKASTNGDIPPHLIDRLKKAELLKLEKESHKNTKINPNNKIDNPYIPFEQLLLEEDHTG